MKNERFDPTLEFQQFKEVMRRVLAMPKKRLDELVEAAKLSSPRLGDPNAPRKKACGSAQKNFIAGRCASQEIGTQLELFPAAP